MKNTNTNQFLDPVVIVQQKSLCSIWRRLAKLQHGEQGCCVQTAVTLLVTLVPVVSPGSSRLVQYPLFLWRSLLSMKSDHYPICISLVPILKTTQSWTLQFRNKVWQSLFCKQVNFIM